MKWIFERCDGKHGVIESAVGLLPENGSMDLNGLGKVDMEELMSVPTDYWLKQLDNVEEYYKDQFGEDLPKELWHEVHSFRNRLTSTVQAA